MIICPNCEHQNPDEATQCEACYTPLPQMSTCPNCGASVQADATFCGQCGQNLQASVVTAEVVSSSDVPLVMESETEAGKLVPPSPTIQSIIPTPQPPATPIISTVEPSSLPLPTATRLQVELATLLHVQTNTKIELPQHLSVIHIGKTNDQVPPDVDVSGFPDSDIVSRIHADIRVEEGIYYIEDTGSSNGTYINHTPLLPGNRHRLRPGDRISLGKGDKVTFIFQMS